MGQRRAMEEEDYLPLDIRTSQVEEDRMVGHPSVNEALGRLKAVLCSTADAELMDSEVAELVGFDEDERRILLQVLEEAGAIEQRRGRVFVRSVSNWWTADTVRA